MFTKLDCVSYSKPITRFTFTKSLLKKEKKRNMSCMTLKKEEKFPPHSLMVDYEWGAVTKLRLFFIII